LGGRPIGEEKLKSADEVGRATKGGGRIWANRGHKDHSQNLTTEHNLVFACLFVTLTYVASWELQKGRGSWAPSLWDKAGYYS